MMDTGYCHLCKKPIVWVRKTCGSVLPIDPDPSADGDLVIITGIVQPPLGDVLTQIFGPEPRFVQHVRTCAVHQKNMAEANKRKAVKK